ncbi:transcription factor [Stylosanthes scabra]|uniref:Transcription factor n=1 Tax=Stylosanthes scabra TaxID=79078 RepID=A0ABU6VNU3_9FABA|nr:transcription factor [Stylosanthes scabra]
MEGSDIYRASNILRTKSSSLWRNRTGGEVFSNEREEDDEEALKWASLEKLPTYNRLRKGLLTTSRGVANEIDITQLGFQDRQKLLDRLLKVAEEDNEKFLKKLRQRIDRVGIDIPTIEVRFEHLNVEAEAYVGSRAVPTFINFAINLVESALNFLHILPSEKKQVTILKDVNGIIKPGRMTLLLGPPSSGKTTLLLALAGKLDQSLKNLSQLLLSLNLQHSPLPENVAAPPENPAATMNAASSLVTRRAKPSSTVATLVTVSLSRVVTSTRSHGKTAATRRGGEATSEGTRRTIRHQLQSTPPLLLP